MNGLALRSKNATAPTGKVQPGERCGSFPVGEGATWLDPNPAKLIVVFGAKTGASALSAPRPLAREITVVRNQRKLDNPLYHLFRSQSSDKAFAASVLTVKIA